MSEHPLPNRELAELASLLGEENVRLLVRTFLQEYPVLLRELETGDRRTQQRVAHSLKSNTRVVGARELSSRLAVLEERLARDDKSGLSRDEVAAIAAELESVAVPLRAFASPP